jgi:hypothetical protein
VERTKAFLSVLSESGTVVSPFSYRFVKVFLFVFSVILFIFRHRSESTMAIVKYKCSSNMLLEAQL